MAILAHKNSGKIYDKVWYFSPALHFQMTPELRLQQFHDQVMNFCQNRSDKKLLIIDEIDRFGGDEKIRLELELFISSLCTTVGQIKLGIMCEGEGCLGLIICSNEYWPSKL